MCSPIVLNILEIGSVSLSLPGEAAPSTKNRGANNCEIILVNSIESVIKSNIFHMFKNDNISE